MAQKEANVRLATLKFVMGKDCYEILQRLPDSENKTTVEETLTALEQYFLPKRNVTYCTKDFSLTTVTKVLARP